MDFAVLGWPPDGPTLDLDHRRFAYAGKFVTPRTGKAVVRSEARVVAAVSFNEDRTDPDRLWIRYLTVRRDRRGDGIGPRLAAATVAHASARGYDAVRIAVNNPYAFIALSRAGFGFTGETTGIAELVLSSAADRASRFGEALDHFADREHLSAEERTFVRQQREPGPPDPVELPADWSP